MYHFSDTNGETNGNNIEAFLQFTILSGTNSETDGNNLKEKKIYTIFLAQMVKPMVIV